MANLFSPQELIPSYWQNVYANSEEDLIFLGSKNLRELRNYWRSTEKELVKKIKRSQELVSLVQKSPDQLRSLAAGYDRPDYITWMKDELEPVDNEAKMRKSGTTTLNICGWCRYAKGLWQAYSYNITSVCQFIPCEYGNGEPYGGNNSKFCFNHQCSLIARLDEEDFLDACAAYVASKHQELLQEKAIIGEKINYLTKLIPQAEPKPYLVCARPDDMFTGGERAMMLLGGEPGILPEYRNQWIAGIIATEETPGVDKSMFAEHFPGIAFFQSNCQTHMDQASFGRGYSIGKGRPELLLESEYKYLKKHPDFAKIWLRHAKHSIDSCRFSFF